MASGESQTAAAARPRVLVVEDNGAGRRIVTRTLANCDCVEAELGSEALSCLAAQPFDLVLLDLGLPDIDGFEVLAQIRANPQLDSLPVIVVTARGNIAEIVRGFEFRADDYVIKPFRPQELQARVQSALRVKFLQDELRALNQNLESEVRARTAQLLAQQQFALVGRNSAQLAHNLNSPLTALMGYLEIALARPADEREELIQKARDVADELQAIIGRLLLGVRSRDMMVEEGRPTDLCDLIVRQIGFWQVHPQFRYKVRVSQQLQPVPKVVIVASDFNQILTNLIDNALYALRERGDARLTFTTTVEDGRVVVGVADNGCGVAPEHLARIFEPQFTTKPVGEGTGLGLASCYELAQACGGHLEVHSELGRGTTFRLLLPPA
ncbi:MAG: hybrid sensor histidine kinase/response regulator [Fimbriimonadaceae bacterium]|nr:hybrid sensor histidine kinase/response regulator [Fimbriimonadaceae bacterium]